MGSFVCVGLYTCVSWDLRVGEFVGTYSAVALCVALRCSATDLRFQSAAIGALQVGLGNASALTVLFHRGTLVRVEFPWLEPAPATQL